MINPYSVVVDVIHVADMDEAYGTYAADDERFDNHDYDDDTGDDNDRENESYTAAGAAPGADAAPGPHGSPGGTFYPEEGPESKLHEVLYGRSSRYPRVIPAR